jgi:hypothetical protein
MPAVMNTHALVGLNDILYFDIQIRRHAPEIFCCADAVA